MPIDTILFKIIFFFVWMLLSKSNAGDIPMGTTLESLSSYQIERHCRTIDRELSISPSNKTLWAPFYGDWWQAYWEPSWTCPLEDRVMFYASDAEKSAKSSGDGGKWVCNLPFLAKRPMLNNHMPCLVYSFGSNGDYSFEYGLMERISQLQGIESSPSNPPKSFCEIHTFDPFTSAPQEGFAISSYFQQIQLHQWGIADKDFVTEPLDRWSKKSMTMKSLASIVKELNHEGRTIDILKIDIDGLELDMLNQHSFWDDVDALGTKVSQLLLEVHFQGIDKETFRFRDKAGNKGHISGPQVDALMRFLTEKGFVIFHKEVNLVGKPSNDACEYSFLRLNIDCNQWKSQHKPPTQQNHGEPHIDEYTRRRYNMTASAGTNFRHGNGNRHHHQRRPNAQMN